MCSRHCIFIGVPAISLYLQIMRMTVYVSIELLLFSKDLHVFCLLMLHKVVSLSFKCGNPVMRTDLLACFRQIHGWLQLQEIGGVSRSGFVHVDLSWLHKLVSIHASLYCLGSQQCVNPPPPPVGARLISSNITHKCAHKHHDPTKKPLAVSHAQTGSCSMAYFLIVCGLWFGRTKEHQRPCLKMFHNHI